MITLKSVLNDLSAEKINKVVSTSVVAGDGSLSESIDSISSVSLDSVSEDSISSVGGTAKGFFNKAKW